MKKQHPLPFLLIFSVLFSVSSCSINKDTQESPILSKTEKAPPKSSFTVISKITGEEITAERGITSGIYTMTRYNPDGIEAMLPYPVTWSNGQLCQFASDKDTSGSISYRFRADTRENTQELAQKYMDALAEKGFSVRHEQNSAGSYSDDTYTLSINNLPEIQLRLSNPIMKDAMTIVLPSGYGFDFSGTEITNTFQMASVFTYPDWNETKDRCQINGFDGSNNGGSFLLCFAPELYHAGDIISIHDFLSQKNAGINNALYYCKFRSDQSGEELYSTLLTGDQESYDYFKVLDVEILRKDAQQTVIYIYMEVDAGIGVVHRLEGLINAISPEGSDSSSPDPDGNCKNCGGKGYINCLSCGGDGEVDCSLCGGDGRKYSVITKKEELCSRCGGRGKDNCGFCNNGRQICPVCGKK